MSSPALKRYALLPFYKDKGARRDAIVSDLKAAGLEPVTDEKGNVIVTKHAEGRHSVLISSHMDVWTPQQLYEYQIGENGEGKIVGTLDNAVGCAINVLLAIEAKPKARTYHVFTVDEESAYQGEDIGAGHVIKAITAMKESPLCISLDVSDDNYGQPFNIENITARGAVRPVERLAKRILGHSPTMNLKGAEDESNQYGKSASAFSVCPIVQGLIHSNNCRMPPENMAEAHKFLQALLQHEQLPGFLDEVHDSWHACTARKQLDSAREALENAGVRQSKREYYRNNGEQWITYAYVVASQDGRFETLRQRNESELISAIERNSHQHKVRDRLGVCLIEFTAEDPAELSAGHVLLPEALQYSIKLHYPDRSAQAAQAVLSQFTKNASQYTKSYDAVSLDFKNGQPFEEVLKILLSAVHGYAQRVGQ